MLRNYFSPLLAFAIILCVNATGHVSAKADPIRPNIMCPPPNPCHPFPTPTPTPPQVPEKYGASVLRAASSGTGASLVLTEGTNGSLAWNCITLPYRLPCPANIEATWYNQYPVGGFNTSFSPGFTYGNNPTTESISVSFVVAPGLYTLGTCFHAGLNGLGPQQCQPFTVQVTAAAPAGGAPGGTINQRIFNQAQFWYNTKVDTSAGPTCTGDSRPGSCACAYAVNLILRQAGFTPIGANTNYVPSVEADLKSGRGQLIPLNQAMPGDIVIDINQDHIGICASAQCSTAYSNSTSRHSFVDLTPPGLFHNTPGRIYRILK